VAVVAPGSGVFVQVAQRVHTVPTWLIAALAWSFTVRARRLVGGAVRVFVSRSSALGLGAASAWPQL
jgi:hypothetical protein